MAGRIAYYGNIVKDGLVFDIDATKKDSYPRTGTIWTDISGYQNNAILTNGPVYDSTNIAGIVFDGTNDYCLVNNNSAINPPSAITVCAFVNMSGFSSNYAPVVFKQNNYAGWYEQYSIGMTNSAIFFIVTGIDRVQKLTIFNVDYRYQNLYLVGTCDTNTDEINLYANGNLINTTAFTSSFDIANTPINIGGTGVLNFGATWTGWLNGEISNVQIYNRALSQSEITQNYNTLKLRYGIQTQNLVTSGLTLLLDAYYPNYISGSTIWYDKSGNNYNGTLVNGPTYDVASKNGIIFDGTNDYVNLGNILNDVFAGTNIKYSISTWVKFNTLLNDTGYAIISKLGDSNFGENQRQFLFYLLNYTAGSYNGFQIEHVSYNNLNSSPQREIRTVGTGLTTNTVYNICLTFDGSINTNEGLDRVNFYVNGVLQPKKLEYTAGTLSNTFMSGSARTALGAYIGQNVANSPKALLNGEIYQTAIYNRVLPIQEVIQNFNALKERYGVVSPPTVTNGLVLSLDASYPNYTSGSTIWYDTSGYQNNGTLTNGPSFSSNFNGGIVFDGVNDYVSIANNDLINFGTGSNVQFTIETCFTLTDLSEIKVIVANRQTDISTDTDYMLYYEFSTNLFHFGTGNAGDSGAWFNVTSAFPNATVSTGKTYYVSATLSATGNTSGIKSFFCNGNSITTSYSVKAPKTTKPIIIGRNANSDQYFLKGNVYFLKIYNRALSAAEIAQNFNALRKKYNI